MLAVGKHHRDAGLAVRLEFAIGQAQGVEQFDIERVALGHAVESDQPDMTTPFPADTTAIRLIHAGNPRAGRGVSERRHQSAG
ncbi:hypothetical protein D3C86_2003630 [compost metagenome]